jgi:hypothetical protein
MVCRTFLVITVISNLAVRLITVGPASVVPLDDPSTSWSGVDWDQLWVYPFDNDKVTFNPAVDL